MKPFCVSKFHGLLLAATMSMLIEYLMGLSDSIVAGNILGETALAGLNLLQTPMNVVSFFANLIGTGTAICFALAVGRFERRRALEFFSQGFWSALAVGGALAAAMVLGRDAFLGVFGADGDVLAMARAYWNAFVPCAFLEIVAVFLSSSCYADGDGRVCVCSYVVQLAVNAGASVVLTMTLGMAGCALGTVLGNLAAVAVLSCHFFRKANTLRLVAHFRFGDLWRICRASFGDASTRLCWAALFFALNCYVIAKFGSIQLPALSVALAILGFSEAFNGVPTAAQPLVGVYMGEGNTLNVRTVMKAAAKVSSAEGIFVSALLLAFPQLAVRVVGIDDPDLTVYACSATRYVSAGLLGWSLLSLFNSYYLFIERVALACSLTFLGNLLVPVALFPILGRFYAESGVWGALGLAPFATVLAFSAFLLLRYGPSRFPLLLDPARDASLRVFNLTLSPENICATSAEIARTVTASALPERLASRVALLVEEVFMAIGDRNRAAKRRTVRAEATLDFGAGSPSGAPGALSLVLRDDGDIFDITDADQRISSLRTYLVASLMESQPNRRNLTTTGFNRNAFRF